MTSVVDRCSTLSVHRLTFNSKYSYCKIINSCKNNLFEQILNVNLKIVSVILISLERKNSLVATKILPNRLHQISS